MSYTITEEIRAVITGLESKGKTEEEDVFLGVSTLNTEATAALDELGWTATYAEAGFYLFKKK